MTNNNSSSWWSSDESRKMYAIDYNGMMVKRSWALYNLIRSLKTCLECYNNNNDNNNKNNKNNNLEHTALVNEMNEERIESLRYDILYELERINDEINNSDLLPDNYVKVTISPRGKRGINELR